MCVLLRACCNVSSCLLPTSKLGSAQFSLVCMQPANASRPCSASTYKAYLTAVNASVATDAAAVAPWRRCVRWLSHCSAFFTACGLHMPFRCGRCLRHVLPWRFVSLAFCCACCVSLVASVPRVLQWRLLLALRSRQLIRFSCHLCLLCSGERALSAAMAALVPGILLLELLLVALCGAASVNPGPRGVRKNSNKVPVLPAEVRIPTSPSAKGPSASAAAGSLDAAASAAGESKGDSKQQAASSPASTAQQQAPLDPDRADAGWRTTHYRTWWRMIGGRVVVNSAVTVRQNLIRAYHSVKLSRFCGFRSFSWFLAFPAQFLLACVMFHLGIVQGDWSNDRSPSTLVLVSVFFALSCYAFVVEAVPLFWWTQVRHQSLSHIIFRTPGCMLLPL